MRVNESITSPTVRLVDEDGKQLGIMALKEALEIARRKGLDLVEVAPNANPPVCRIMDYGRMKYLESKKRHESKKKQAHSKVKEMKLSIKTHMHDLSFKVKHIKRFLEDGDKAKVTVFMRGREVVFRNKALEILNKVIEMLPEGSYSVEQQPRVDGNVATMVLAPPKKKQG